MAPKPAIASGSGSNSTKKLSSLEAKINKAGLAANNATITQKELLERLSLTVTQTTMDAINALLRKGLMNMFKNGKDEVSYKFVGKDAARTMGEMESDEKLIYEQIQDAGNLGMWTKTLTENTRIPRVNMTRALKVLESRKLIVSIKSVKAPTRKMYIKVGVIPSVEITGGPWFTDNELDTEFIEQLKSQASFYLKKRTVPSLRLNTETNTTYPTLAAADYPTAGEIRKFLAKIITQVDLREAHVADLLEVMVQDGTVERIFVKRMKNDDDEEEEDDDEDGDRKKKRKREDSGSDSEEDRKSKNKSSKKKIKLSSSSKSSKKSKKSNGSSSKSKKSSSSKKKSKRIKGGDEDESEEEESSEEEDFDSDEDAEAAEARKSTSAMSKKGGTKRKERKRKQRATSGSGTEEDEEGMKSDTSESSQDESEQEEESFNSKRNRLTQEATSYGRDHVYRLTTPYKPRIGRTDMPCGPCPVESFCSEPSRPLGRHHNKSSNLNLNKSNSMMPMPMMNGKKSKGSELLGRPRQMITLGIMQGVGMLGGGAAAIGASNEKWGDSGGRVGSSIATVNPKTCEYMSEWLDF